MPQWGARAEKMDCIMEQMEIEDAVRSAAQLAAGKGRRKWRLRTVISMH